MIPRRAVTFCEFVHTNNLLPKVEKLILDTGSASSTVAIHDSVAEDFYYYRVAFTSLQLPSIQVGKLPSCPLK